MDAEQISIRTPDDWHIHLRDNKDGINMLDAVLPLTARTFARGLIMPNLVPPVRTRAEANAYKGRIQASLVKHDLEFEPVMALYLTDDTDPKSVSAGDIFKLYPANATTNSASGVSDIKKCFPIFERMEEVDAVLSIHGERLAHVDGSPVDVFDAERFFFETSLSLINKTFPRLRTVAEHITTKEGADYVTEYFTKFRLAATITPHHLRINRNHIFRPSLRPTHYCLPVAKRELHRVALVEASTSGLPCFFAGTDSAPHSQDKKENACGCAGGICCGEAGVELYVDTFDRAGKLNRVEPFLSEYGADFYGVPHNDGTITLERCKPWAFEKKIEVEGAKPVIPFPFEGQDEPVGWKIVR